MMTNEGIVGIQSAKLCRRPGKLLSATLHYIIKRIRSLWEILNLFERKPGYTSAQS